VAEVLYGIERLPRGKRKTAIRRAALEVFGRFADEILAFDAAAALLYAEIVDRRDRLGTPISGYDAQIAAICRAHGATLATRNTGDFENTGVEVLNPWNA
jgi:toxin FitB